MKKELLLMPNGKVWVGDLEKKWIEGVVKIDCEKVDDYEAFQSALSEEVIGSINSLCEFTYRIINDKYVAFSGFVHDMDVDNEDYKKVRSLNVITDKEIIENGLKQQYGMSDVEISHAISSFMAVYENETIVHAGKKEIRSPAHPTPCHYVRICMGGLELMHWSSDEWKDGPEEVMGAIIGLLKVGE